MQTNIIIPVLSQSSIDYMFFDILFNERMTVVMVIFTSKNLNPT